jgi:hypothetical protein
MRHSENSGEGGGESARIGKQTPSKAGLNEPRLR